MILSTLVLALFCGNVVSANFQRENFPAKSGIFAHFPDMFTLSEPVSSSVERGVKPGWGFMSQYSGSCGNQPSTISGFMTNICYNFNFTAFGMPSQSLSFSCGIQTGTIRMFDGVDCRPENLNQTQVQDVGKCMKSETYPGHSTMLRCTADGDHLPLPKGKWFTYLDTRDPECNKPITFSALANGKCLSNPDYSSKFNFPTVQRFEGSGCRGQPAAQREEIVDQCMSFQFTPPTNHSLANSAHVETESNKIVNNPEKTNDKHHHNKKAVNKGGVVKKSADEGAYYYYYDDAYYYYSSGFGYLGPTGIVKLLDIKENPQLPKVDDARVAFNVTQTLSGIDISTYLAHREEHDMVLAKTVCKVMSGVQPENVKILAVGDSAAALLMPGNIPPLYSIHVPDRTAAASTGTTHLREKKSAVVVSGVVSGAVSGAVRTLTGSSVKVKYAIVLPSSSAAGYNTPSQAYNTTLSSLLNALSQGTFTQRMQEIATDMNVAALVTVTSTAATYTTFTSETVTDTSNTSSDDDSDSKKKGLSPGAIAGIVIALVIIIALIIGGVVYCMRNKRNNTVYTAGGGESNHNEKNYAEQPGVAMIASAPPAQKI